MIIDLTQTETERKLKHSLELKEWIHSTLTDMLMSEYERQLAAGESDD